MRRLQLYLLLTLPWLLCEPRIPAQETTSLDNNSVVQMVKWHLKDAEIIADIGRNQTNFELSAATIKDLKGQGVSESVIDAMFTAAKKSAGSPAAVPKNADLKAKPVTATPTPPPSGDTDPPVPQTTPPPQAAVTPQPTVVIPAHTPARLAAAIHTTAPPLTLAPLDTACPADNNGKIPSQRITLYFPSGTSDPTTVNDSGSTCFVVQGFNNILYTPTFALTETPPSDTAFADLQDAITKVTALSFGNVAATSQAKVQALNNKSLVTPACPAGLPAAITTAQGAATQFGNALAAINPGKDVNGNVNLVDVATTVAKWQPVPPAYRQFEAAVSQLIAVLQQPDVDVCSDEWLSAAENIVLEVYSSSPSGARNEFAIRQRLVDSDHNVRFTSRLHGTSSYTLTVTANNPQGKVANGSVTFSLAAGRKVLSTSGGFLVTDVPNPSYASVTAPNGTATQNVLAVNNPTGPTVGLVALVDVYLPNIHFGQHKFPIPLNGHAWGLAFSAGPTYNVSNGKADTTKFGLFAGPSLHIRNQFFLTPGFNLAQYSALPQGFTQAGQVIPPNSGTPTGISRWTTRFAFALTYKIKDFGQSTTANQVSGNQAGNPAPAPTPSPTPTPTPAKKKTGAGN